MIEDDATEKTSKVILGKRKTLKEYDTYEK